MHPYIKKYIFIGLTLKQIDLIKALKEEFFLNHDDVYFIFMPAIDELFYHTDSNTLVISDPSPDFDATEILLKLGHPFYIPWSQFLQNFHNLLNLQNKQSTRKICLSFMTENFLKLYKNLLAAYGHNTFTTADPADLEEILDAGIDYLVFDMDMNQASEKVRFRTMQKIRYHCKKGLKVNVIKNFDTGSLFNDILSPVKEISNILLSPEEYFLFLRKYLYTKELEIFFKDNPERINAFLNIRQHDETRNSMKTGSEIFSDIRDGKKSYNQILNLKNNLHWHELTGQRSDIDLRYILSSAVENFVTKNIDNSQRELFTFFPH